MSHSILDEQAISIPLHDAACNRCDDLVPAGFYGLYSITYTFFSAQAGDSSDPVYEAGAFYNFLLRVSASRPNADFAHTLCFDAWCGATESPSDAHMTGATIDEKNSVVLGSESHVPIMVQLRQLRSQRGMAAEEDAASAIFFYGCTLVIERVCCCECNIYVVPPRPVGMMAITALKRHWYTHSTLPGSRAVDVPDIIPRCPVSIADAKRARQQQDERRTKRIAMRKDAPAPSSA